MAKKNASKVSKAQSDKLDQSLKSLDTLPQDFQAPHQSLVFRAVRAEAALAPVRAKKAWQGFRIRRTAFIGAAMACSAAAFLTFGLTSHQISDPATLANGGQTASDTASQNLDGAISQPNQSSGTVQIEPGGKVVVKVPNHAKSGRHNKPSKPAVKKNPKLNIVMSNNQSLGSQTSASAPAGASGSASIAAPGAAADMKMSCLGIWRGWCGSVITKYVASNSISSKPTTGHVYQLVSNQSPKELGTTIASAFGLNDSVHSWVDQYSGQTNYFVGTDPNSTDAWTNNSAGVVIYQGGNSNYWYYYNQAAAIYVDCVKVAQPSDASATTDVTVDPAPCEYLPPTSSKAPNQEDALAFAHKVFDQLGYQTVTSIKHAKDNSVLLSYQNDVWGSTVMANLVVNGEPTTVSWYIYWNGLSGQVVNMSGINSIAKDAGLFDTLSASKAAERVGSWQWSGAFYTNNDFNWGNNRPYPSFPPLCSAVYPTPEPVVIDPNTGDPATDSPIKPEPPVAIPDPEPCVQEPSTNLISMTSSQSTLMQILDADQNIWLVPGYLYFDDYGYVQSAISLPDGVIKLPENAPIVVY